MEDHSRLDKKYFIDTQVYNCPYCNRRNVRYNFEGHAVFNWTDKKICWVYFVKCSYCNNKSMHLSFEDIRKRTTDKWQRVNVHEDFEDGIDIDSKIFYSAPTSFFVLDDRIPSQIRELISEAEGCLKMNFLTGASACTRKAIYEFLVVEKASGKDYEEKIKSLKGKYPGVDETYFDILSHIQDMTSDKVHEQSWDKWDSRNLKLIIETLKSILYEVYVLPSSKAERVKQIQELRKDAIHPKKSNEKSKEEK